MTTVIDSLDVIREKIHKGQLDEAREALAGVHVGDENRGEVQFLQGFLLEANFDRIGALEAYQAVLELDPDHAAAAFRAALLLDQFGEDADAISMYERCVGKRPAHANAMINLAVLYEEHGDLDGAEDCLEDVLTDHPNNWRARHFLRSVRSSYTMVYDERTQKERERRSAVLDMPISDFELSVRSRNCLRQMNIRSLGDLLKTTEPELLSYKNFGETSLSEIKAMLTQKGLRLGQSLQVTEAPAPLAVPSMPGDALSQSHRSVADLELSMRSRKALQRLGIVTLGELTERSEAELLAIKNFGQTSLAEIKRQLEKFGLSFRHSTL